MKKITFIIPFFFLKSTFAQDTGFKFPQTPESSSFNSFFNQISTSSTGNPNINIPLYSIDIGGTSVPISLNYIGGTGIKVDDIASRVGLGWQLDIGGGSVIRNIVGRPDGVRPKLKNSYDVDEICTSTSDKDLLTELVATEMDPFFPHPSQIGLDMRPDIYSYSLLNSSGKFLYDYMGKAQQIPRSDNIISDNSTNLSIINIIDNAGTHYSFKNVVTSIPFKMGFEGHIYTDNYKPAELNFSNSEKLTFLYGKRFSFKQYTTNSQTEFSKKNNIEGFCNSLPKETYTYYGSRTLEDVITEIDFPKGRIVFNYGEEYREDLIGDKYLKNIVVYSKTGKAIKSYTFAYDYFLSDYTDQSNLIFTESVTGKNYKRLRLLSITDDITGGIYKFEYEYLVPLPPRFSSSVDSWGLYNGKKNGNTRVGSLIEDNHLYYADRSFDENYAKSAMLKKITYPTKGTTEIHFEPDDYYFNSSVEEYSDLLDFNDQPQNSNNIFIYSDQIGQQISKTFTVNSNDFDFRGRFYSEMYDGIVNPIETIEECKVTISTNGSNTIYRANGEIFLNPLPNKTYTVSLVNNAQNSNKCYFDILHRHKSSKIILNKAVGSFRVQKIIQEDNNSNTYTKQYEYKNNDGRSTGIMMDEDINYRFIEDNFYKNKLGQPVNCIRFASSSDPQSHINSHFGKPISYTKIVEKRISGSEEIKKENFYKNESIGNYQFALSSVNPKPIEEYKNGILYKTINYRGNDKIAQTIYENEYDYYFNQFSNDEIGAINSTNPRISQGLTAKYDNIIICLADVYGATFTTENYPIYSAWVKPISETTTQYYGDGYADSISVKKQYFYSPNYLHIKPVREKVIFDNGNILNTYYSFPFEKSNQYLINKNMVGIPLQTNTTKTANEVTTTLSDVEIKYPTSQTEANNKTTGLSLPYEVVSKDLLGVPNTEIKYSKYDNNGNLQEYILKPDFNGDGFPVSIIWDYNQTQPIAKIEGAKLSDIPQGLIANIVNASDYSNPSYSESNLIDQLDAFRIGLPGYQISTYTYKPLIRVSSITPPSGIREIYKYDTANRLQSVVDVDGNILKEYSYQYKQ